MTISTNQGKYLGGSADIPQRDMWIVAYHYKQESIMLNGAVTCVRRRETTKKPRRILG